MEKRKPHYRLSEVQILVDDPTSRPFTVTALRNGLALGLTEKEMRQVVLKLSRREFYKSMTSYENCHVWQDVYHGMTEDGTAVYIKICGFEDGRPPVVQFKAK